MLYRELEDDLRDAGSVLVLSFDKLTVADASDLRVQLRDAGVKYKVVKNRLASRAAKATLDVDIAPALRGKCGIVIAPEEKAIAAARLVREAMKKKKGEPPVVITGGVIEGQAIVGAAAGRIADLPDRQTVRTQVATAILGPARGIATALHQVASGLARCIQARIDQTAKPADQPAAPPEQAQA
jgi:ribosomal protein L10